MAAAGGERWRPAGRALCLLLLCGWALAARGQDSPGERRGAGWGAGCGLWALRGRPAGLSRRSLPPVSSVGPEALCGLGRRGSCLEETGPSPRAWPGPLVCLGVGWGQRALGPAQRKGSARAGGGRPPARCAPLFVVVKSSLARCFIHQIWDFFSNYSGCVSGFSLPLP